MTNKRIRKIRLKINDVIFIIVLILKHQSQAKTQSAFFLSSTFLHNLQTFDGVGRIFYKFLGINFQKNKIEICYLDYSNGQIGNYFNMGNQACLCCQDLQQQNSADIIDIDVINKKQSLKNNESFAQSSLAKVDTPRFQEEQQLQIQSIPKPQLLPIVQQILQTHRPFVEFIHSEYELRKYGSDLYEGPTNEKNQPHGFGTMYYPSGAVFVGQFSNGVATGPAHYILPNGSFYKGKMENNVASDQKAYFESENIKYEGGVKENKFEGKGKEIGKTHEFEGFYQEGRKVRGILKWRAQQETNQKNQNSTVDDQTPLKKLLNSTNSIENEENKDFNFQYEGQFDENSKFIGNGKLKCPKGTYEGNFVKGTKQGNGVFLYKNGLKYEGTYVNNIKEGKGTIFKADGSVAYSGQVKNGMPHGRGYVLNSEGKQVMMDWNEGISQHIKEVNNLQVVKGK